MPALRLPSLVHLFLVVVTCLLAGLARAADVPTAPQLRIDPGEHTATIKRIAADRAGRWLVTASNDKTARVWDLADGRLVTTLRPPMGPGDEGKLNAVAISPDGETVAVAGWTGWDWDGSASIYLFDRGSGRLRQRLVGLEDVVLHLTFSPDGRQLAASVGVAGVRIFALPEGRMLGADREYGEEDSHGVEFSPDGRRLVTTGWDGKLRLYDVGPSGLNLRARESAPGGRKPYRARFSPDGRWIAVGFVDTSVMNVLAADTLALRATLETTGVGGVLGTPAWSRDGTRLHAAGGANRDGQFFIRRWPMSGARAGVPVDWPVARDSVFDLAALPDGSIAFGSGEPTWGVVDGSGRVRLRHAPAVADYRNSAAGFSLSADGSRVRFSYEVLGRSPSVFDVRRRALLAPDTPDLQPPRFAAPGLVITDWMDTTAPKCNGQPVALKQYESSRSLALLPDAAGRPTGFVLGADWSLRAFDVEGRERWRQPVPGTVWSLNVSADGRWVVAAYSDGTIRWHRATDGAEQLAFYPHPDRKRWVLWSPSGFFDASPGAESLIGWHVNRGRDQAADFFPAAQFRTKFYRPDVIAALLDTADEVQALARADAEAGRRTTRTDIAQALPPVVRVVSPGEGDRFTKPQVQLRYRARTAADAPVTGAKVLVDGRPLETARGLRPVGNADADGVEFVLDLTLPGRDVVVSVVAENRHGPSEARSVRLRWDGQAEAVLKPRLYVLAIGVAAYDGAKLKLGFPVKDAEDVVAAFQAQSSLYREVVVKLLRNPSAPEFLDGLEWLRDEVTARDVGAFFYAGHGMNDRDNDFYFLTREAVPDRLRRTAVPYLEVKKTLGALPSKVLAFIDACHSGNAMGGRRGVADINAVASDLAAAENGVVVFTSSTGNQFSLEDEAWRNGAFTKALVEGLNGQADLISDGRITIAELEAWIADRVKKLTRNQQTPTTTRPPAISDFPIAVTR